jgi:hypothetical protein
MAQILSTFEGSQNSGRVRPPSWVGGLGDMRAATRFNAAGCAPFPLGTGTAAVCCPYDVPLWNDPTKPR